MLRISRQYCLVVGPSPALSRALSRSLGGERGWNLAALRGNLICLVEVHHILRVA